MKRGRHLFCAVVWSTFTCILAVGGGKIDFLKVNICFNSGTVDQLAFCKGSLLASFCLVFKKCIGKPPVGPEKIFLNLVFAL